MDGNKVLIQYHVKIMTLRTCLLGLVCILPLNWMMNFLRILWHLKKKKNTKQLLFDPSYEKNVEYQDVSFKEWKLSREDVKKYATIIIRI